MAVPVPSTKYCIFNNNDFFYQEPNELAFNQDTCCYLVICLQLIASHWHVKIKNLGPYLQHFIFFVTSEWAQQVGVLHYTWQERVAMAEHSGPFVSNEENKVL
jgi:hypothetical protein